MGRKFGSKLGFALLEVIFDGVDIVEISNRRPGLLLRYDLHDLRTLEAERSRKRVRASLLRMERRGLIQKKIDETRSGYFLTELGLDLLSNKLIKAIPMPSGWVTLVSFDIPESQKRVRQEFRKFLRSLGFRLKHQSVWVSDMDWASTVLSKRGCLSNPEWIFVYKAQLQAL